ncbi:MAG: metallophosphoesterase [Paludibacteraceae bacterium]|nr:metallophosphoesterase [Paludibacteraceae bacterium]
MKKGLLAILLGLMMVGCKPPVIFPTYTLEVDDEQMSTVPGVLVEQPYGVITLSFSDEIDESVLQNLRLVDYTDPVPTVLPKSSIAGVSFTLDPNDEEQVLLDCSKLKSSEPRAVTLAYENEEQFVTAHMMLVPDTAATTMYEEQKVYTAVISDIHLNDQRSMDGEWSWFIENQPYLIEYLDNLIENKDKYKELVLLGDLFDEVVTPIPLPTFAVNGVSVSEKDYLRAIANVDENKEVLDKIKEVQSAGIQVIYVPGNHDSGVDEDLLHEFFGSGAKFVSDVQGLGSYISSDMLMEHSHRYDAICSPDPYSNIGIDEVTQDNAFMSIQYFNTRIAATHRQKGLVKAKLSDYGYASESDLLAAVNQSGTDDFNKLVMALVCNVVLIAKHVEGIDTMAIPTGLYGLTGDYVMDEYFYLSTESEPLLYQTMWKQEEWERRLLHNNAPADFPFLLGALICEVPFADAIAVNRLFGKDDTYKVVVFGHTHIPYLRIMERGDDEDGYIYANTGSWVDENACSHPVRTAVEIYDGDQGRQVRLVQMGKDYQLHKLSNALWTE